MIAPEWLKRNRWLFLPLASALAMYASTLRGQFVWDDKIFLTRWILGTLSVKALFFPIENLIGGNYYHPVTHAWQLALYFLFGPHPFAWRAAGLLLHLVTTASLFFLLRRWLSRVAKDLPLPVPLEAVGATLFAVWPAASEALVWVAANAEVLMTMCMVIALNLHLRARDRGTSSFFSAIFFFAAILAKEVGIVFLPLAVAATVLVPMPEDAPKKPPRAWYASAIWLPHVLAWVGYSALRRHAMGAGVGLGTIASERLRDPETFRAAFHAWGFYAREMLLLGPGSPILESIPVSTVNDLFGTAAALALVAVTAYGVVRKRWELLLGPAWIAVTLAPPLAFAAHPLSVTAVAHRYLYAPQIGFWALVCVGIAAAARRLAPVWRPRATAAVALAGAALAICVGVFFQRVTAPWMSDDALWTAELHDDPMSLMAWGNLATQADARGEIDIAEADARIAAWTAHAQDTPQKHDAFVHLAEMYLQHGKVADARVAILQAAKLPGTREGIGNSLALAAALDLLAGGPNTAKAHLKDTAFREVVLQLEQACAMDPLDGSPRVVLATISENLGEPVRARHWYLEYLRTVMPGSAPAQWAQARADANRKRVDEETDPVKKHYFLGEMAFDERRLDDAEREFTESSKADPTNVEVLNALAGVEAGRQRWDDAAKTMEAAVAVEPRNPTAWFNLGYYREVGEHPREAAAAFETAIELRPDWGKAYVHRGLALEHQGNLEGAEESFRAALERLDPTLVERPLIEEEIVKLEARRKTKNVTLPFRADEKGPRP